MVLNVLLTKYRLTVFLRTVRLVTVYCAQVFRHKADLFVGVVFHCDLQGHEQAVFTLFHLVIFHLVQEVKLVLSADFRVYRHHGLISGFTMASSATPFPRSDVQCFAFVSLSVGESGEADGGNK